MVLDIVSQAEKDDVKFVNLQFTDICGNIKSTTIPVERLAESLEKGTWFDGSSIEGFARIHESDMFLKPDPGTYAVLPWEPQQRRVARLICDVYTPGSKPFEGDPRHILKRAAEEAAKMGFIYNVGPELEFFLFKFNGGARAEPVPHDVGSYFDHAPRDLATQVRREIIFALESLGLEVEMSHHEVAIGQHEIDFKYDDALRTADNAITFKHAVKAIAHAHGLHATFMPKPMFGHNGSGMHVHQSLFMGGENVFFDPGDKYKLSETARHFIAGQLAHVREMSAVLAPTVNSYKRLVPGYEAPVYICWAQINRSALIRIPRYSEGREQSTRAELRCPDPSCNPYLAFAAMLWAGLDGIRNSAKPPEPVEEDVYHLRGDALESKGIRVMPSTLAEAIDEFERSELMKQAFGSGPHAKYVDTKRKEWDEFRLHVTDWEKERYFETL